MARIASSFRSCRMLIDEFLPQYDVSARYRIDVHSPLHEVYSAARFVDMRSSEMGRWLCRLRGLPQEVLTLDGMMRQGFVLLAEMPPQEFVPGLNGHFWTPSPQVQLFNADTFITFDRPGFAKAVVNMAFIAQGNGSIRVTTETRVHCPD